MTIVIPTLIPFITVMLGIAVFAFSVIRWLIDQKRIRQLVSVYIASILENIAAQCLSITYDEGSWDEGMKVDANFSSTPNNPTANIAPIPTFADIKNVEYIGRTHLNRLLALAPIVDSIQSHLSNVLEYDLDWRGDYFYTRQVLYAGYGEYVSRLAKNIRLDVKAPGIGTLADETTERIKKQFAKLIIFSGRESEDIKYTYERVFLPISESYWPKVVKSKSRKLNHATKISSAKP